MQEKRNLNIFIPTMTHDRKSLYKAYEDVMEVEKKLQKLRKNNFTKIFTSSVLD